MDAECTHPATFGGTLMHAVESCEARDLTEAFATFEEGAPPVLGRVVRPLEKRLASRKVVAFGVSVGPEGGNLSFACASPALLAEGTAALASLVRTRPRDFAAFDSESPDLSQRNVALLRSDLAARTAVDALPVAREVFPCYGLSRDDFVRVLVCDGPSLLAWVGAFRREPFGPRERDELQRLVPALRRRLVAERLLRDTRLAAAAFCAAVEAVGAPAFVLSASGRVLHANGAGCALIDRDRRSIEEQLRAALAGRPNGYEITRLISAAAPDHFFVVQRAPMQAGRQVAAAASRWGLTPRQREVLALLAAGKCNKTIAAELGCAPRTVELHVSACLDKAQCEQRAELVAKLWRE